MRLIINCGLRGMRQAFRMEKHNTNMRENDEN